MNKINKTFYRLLLMYFCWLSVSSPIATASEQRINFAINSPGSPPYLYFDPKSQAYQGVVVDFFNGLAEQSSVTIRYLDSSRARSERFLRLGKADMFLSGVEWLDDPTGFVLSNTIMAHESYLYATSAFTTPFVPSAHKGKSVCTRFGFIYPVLQPYFDDETLVRVNSASQTTMAMMMTKGRCDFLIMSEQNALSVLNKTEFCDSEFYQSPDVISKVDLVLVIRQKRAALKPLIDQYLAEFINTGQLDASILRHSGNHHFPKLKCH